MKISSNFSLSILSKFLLSIPLAAVLTACGGGGGGGGNTSQDGSGQVGVAKFDVSIATDANVTLQPGASMNFPGFASTSDAPLAGLVWSLTAPSGAPTMGGTNSSCAVSNKVINKTSSDWACQASMTAPIAASKPLTYTLVLTATDTLNNVRTASRNITVNYDPNFVPLVTSLNLGQPFTVVSGATAPLSCPVTTGSTVSWSVTDNAGLPILLSSYGSAQTSFLAPTVKTNTPITVSCSVTDAAKQTSVGSVVVTVQPAPPSPPPIL
jgi:hypothetical protein